MRFTITLAALLLAAAASPAGAAERLVDRPAGGRTGGWPSTPPPSCPFPPSADLKGLSFTGKNAAYSGADTWYPSWASDGNMYSPFTDGTCNNISASSGGDDPNVGFATIVGSDPLRLTIRDPGLIKGSAKPYRGRYPCGSLVYNGVWYYGTYCLNPEWYVEHDGVGYNWPFLGPFMGFHISKDYGKTWTPSPSTASAPLFGEHAPKGETVRIGAPHFVDFGRNMENSPDGKAYLVAHGADATDTTLRFANTSWITGDNIYLLRVKPSPETMNNPSAYEFYAGTDARGKPFWSQLLTNAKPIAAWDDRMGCVTMTYDAPLKRYLMCVTDGVTTMCPYNTYILESKDITGPWRLVTYMQNFGPQAYFVNIPSKFISADGRSMWLCYSANWGRNVGTPLGESNPPGSGYAMCLQEIQLLSQPVPLPVRTDLDTEKNLARAARVTASSEHEGYNAEAVADGVVDGFPGDLTREWASNGEKAGAWVQLNWDQPRKMDRIVLFDRPNDLDQVVSGRLTFSDGPAITVSALPDDAQKGVEVTFPERTASWVRFTVADVKKGAENIGLSEFAVFDTESAPADKSAG